jgi:hypothetical protein
MMEQVEPTRFVALFSAFVAMFFVIVLMIVPWWKICTKAGFPGALALLMLVPVANIILPFYIAFADWPNLHQGGPRPPSTP